jgi:hypothetical protein
VQLRKLLCGLFSIHQLASSSIKADYDKTNTAFCVFNRTLTDIFAAL